MYARIGVETIPLHHYTNTYISLAQNTKAKDLTPFACSFDPQAYFFPYLTCSP
jgi:hypothetical protein